jgi:glutaredoxin 2
MARIQFALIFIGCIFSCGDAKVLRGQSDSYALSVESSGDWATYAQAESEDRNFLLEQLDDTESELVKLQQFLVNVEQTSGVLAGLQLSATPGKKNVTEPVANRKIDADKKKTIAPVADAKVDAAALAASAAADPMKLVASLSMPNSKIKNIAALAPMLAMLKGLYADSKDRISQQNTREEKSKKWFSDKEAEHKRRMDTIEAKFKNHTLSEEFRTNETRDENRYFSYWSRCRERQHRQFHTNLKIQHAMMNKVKKMIDMYEKTLSGKASDQEAAKKQLGQVTGGMPEIVFLQDAQRSVSSFCSESLGEVRKARGELQQMAREILA